MSDTKYLTKWMFAVTEEEKNEQFENSVAWY